MTFLFNVYWFHLIFCSSFPHFSKHYQMIVKATKFIGGISHYCGIRTIAPRKKHPETCFLYGAIFPGTIVIGGNYLGGYYLGTFFFGAIVLDPTIVIQNLWWPAYTKPNSLSHAYCLIYSQFWISELYLTSMIESAFRMSQ